MPRYYDMDKLAEMAQAKADTILPPGNIAFSSVAKWLELLPAADVAPRAEVAREIVEEIERLITKECLVFKDENGIRGYVDASVHYAIAELKKKYQ